MDIRNIRDRFGVRRLLRSSLLSMTDEVLEILNGTHLDRSMRPKRSGLSVWGEELSDAVDLMAAIMVDIAGRRQRDDETRAVVKPKSIA